MNILYTYVVDETGDKQPLLNGAVDSIATISGKATVCPQSTFQVDAMQVYGFFTSNSEDWKIFNSVHLNGENPFCNNNCIGFIQYHSISFNSILVYFTCFLNLFVSVLQRQFNAV